MIMLRRDANGDKLYAIEVLGVGKTQDAGAESAPRSETAPNRPPAFLTRDKIAYYVGAVNAANPRGRRQCGGIGLLIGRGEWNASGDSHARTWVWGFRVVEPSVERAFTFACCRRENLEKIQTPGLTHSNWCDMV